MKTYLLDQLAFYGAYHNNRWNQLIHFIFVPSIMWSLCVWLSVSGPLFPLPESLSNTSVGVTLTLYKGLTLQLVPNASCLLVVMYSLYYLSLEPVAGLTWMLIVGLPLWLTSTAFYDQVANAMYWALLVHVLSWYMQIHPGHALLEKRKPALMDSLVQAVSLAPLFVWFELLFLFGYRPELQSQLKARVSADIAAWRKKKSG
ncbi:hypothetical protein CEUSTIGMA_g915.t1 [Chlamydomonas eustigma]|uniref:DUF962 domain-containing protein n=1 Tax=Chlamydomonas eustigma TaxID=1157962 RepID=A0A250WRN0_9CHLO|nr:hypothetical protein CEUSTIGMA_g915.t1 [Chlamydomonas eustigma]|eukprot:GAX73463.1 hypothetical protein CEUSTIGMA_g915.t1 [Chlamydomonas eustigma]